MNTIAIVQSHSSAASLMQDGAIVAMVQEERLSKRKNQVAFPLDAIKDIVAQHLDGDFGKIDRVVLAENRIDPYGIALDRYSEFDVHDHVGEQHRLWYPKFYGDGIDVGQYWLDEYASNRFRNKDHHHDLSFLATMSWEEATEHFNAVERPRAVREHLGWRGEIVTVDHHTCHAHYAAYGAPLAPGELTDALVLTGDAWGEGRNWSAWVAGADGKLELIADGADNALARIYKFATLILGMKPNEHEYKVMGLAAYGKSKKHIDAVEAVFSEAFDFRDGKFVADRPLTDSYFDLKNRLEGYRFDNIAAGLQAWTSRVATAWARHWLKETGKRVLCFSGGLAMNIKLNGDLLELPEVRKLSVPASGGDESLCAGASFYDRLAQGQSVTPMRHVYLGSLARNEDWTARLGDTGMTPDDFGIIADVTAAQIARLIAAGHVVARCAGPSEFGARSLGNRSILADPSRKEIVKTINDAIKNRDFWMPFTPSILREYADDYIVNPKGVDSPFMTIGFESRPDRRDQLIGGLHPADFSGRPQFVDRETNAPYWEIIDQFRRLTGIPALLNTSLNLHGEPMNYTVADAVRTVALSDLNFLVMPDGQLLCKKASLAVATDCIR